MNTSMNMTFGLALFVLVLGVGIYALRKLQARNLFGHRPAQMRIVETLALSPRTKLAVLSIGNREVLIGVSATGVSKISEWDAVPKRDATPDGSPSSRSPQSTTESA